METIPTVRDIMTRDVITVSPDMDMYMAINTLLDHRISGAPVVDIEENQKRLVGILSAKDCMKILTNGAFYDLPEGRVGDYMSRKIKTIDPGRDIFAVAEMFIRNHFRRVPVEEKGILVGVVSRGDVLTASRRLWLNQHAKDAPDPGYINERLKARLGDAGISHLHKKFN